MSTLTQKEMILLYLLDRRQSLELTATLRHIHSHQHCYKSIPSSSPLLKTLLVLLNEKKIKIQSNLTVLKNVVWVKSPAYPARIYVNLVSLWMETIFIDDTFNLALRPLATRRLNIANLHVKTKAISAGWLISQRSRTLQQDHMHHIP
jgi:hypothetical protein